MEIDKHDITPPVDPLYAYDLLELTQEHLEFLAGVLNFGNSRLNTGDRKLAYELFALIYRLDKQIFESTRVRRVFRAYRNAEYDGPFPEKG